MIEIKTREKCAGCHTCANVCPQSCITMRSDTEGFWYPQIDKDNCNSCGLCEASCPIINRKELIKFDEQKAYACYNKDDTIRLESSSGGLFTVIADTIIEDGGVVFGAAFDEGFNVVHSFVECKEDLSCFRGSKYVQSRIGSSYKVAEGFLKKGRRVLFTGTPCQIAGLKSYLKQEYSNLLCQDIICHGVPSPNVWQKYIAFREKKAGAAVKSASYRSKINGWKTFSLSILHENGVEYSGTINSDMYLIAFNRNLYLRPSCYSCAFKTEQREADITLSDFWGIQDVAPGLDDDKGTSLLLIHSKKGQMVFDEIKDKIISLQVSLKEAIKYNPSMTKSMPIHPYREKFFAEMNISEFDILIKKYCTDKLRVKVKMKAKFMIRKVLVRLGMFDLMKKLLSTKYN